MRLVRCASPPLGDAARLCAASARKLNEEAIAHFLQPALQGRVRFGTPADVGTRILPGLLALFARSHPGVEVDVSVARSIDMIERIDAGELDLALITTGNLGQDDSRASRSTANPWSGPAAAAASPRCARHCRWRWPARTAPGAGRPRTRSTESGAATASPTERADLRPEAAMIADLAIAPYPASLVRPPLQRLDGQYGLPQLGDYRINLLRGSNRSDAVEVLAAVIAAFAEYRSRFGGHRPEASEEPTWHAG